MSYAICTVPAAAVRKKPSHKVEMVNQFLFGEVMRIVKEKKNWLKVQGIHDNYEGWIRSNMLSPLADVPINYSLVAGDMINTIIINKTKMLIPVGSSLPAHLKDSYKGFSFNRSEVKPGEVLVHELTANWLNAPYLWGGRTPLGIDCSGFTQVIFKMMGIDLLRDAWQQAGQGMKVKKLEDARCGDLAFFKNTKGKITHVGILLNTSQIIHASGKVRIDAIDKKGITNGNTGKRTHVLAEIKRYW